MSASGNDEIEPTEIDASTEETVSVDSIPSDITGHILDGYSEAGNEAVEEADILALDDRPWYEQEFMNRYDEHEERCEFPEQGCELPRVLRLLFDEEERWQLSGNIILAPHEFEQLSFWLPNLRWLRPEEVPSIQAVPTPTIIDSNAPLPERLAQLLEQMQPGFRKRPGSGMYIFVFAFLHV